MKKICMAFALVVVPFALATAQQGEVVEEVIVKINDDIITLSQFNEQFEAGREQLARQLQGEELEEAAAQYRRVLFNILVNMKLMEQRAKRLGLRMPEEYFQQTLDYFKQQSGSRTEEEFQRALADNGLTMEDLREISERRYLQRALFQREILFQEEENLESKVQEYYERNSERYRTAERYNLSQIVFPYTTATQDDAAAQAAIALGRIRSGEDFAVVYRDVTPQAAPDADGDIGEVTPDSMREELREAIVGKDAGEVTDVIDLGTALVVVKITDKQEARAVPLEEIQQQVLNDMQNERVAKGLQDLVLRYKQESYIEIKSPEFLALYDPKSTRLEL